MVGPLTRQLDQTPPAASKRRTTTAKPGGADWVFRGVARVGGAAEKKAERSPSAKKPATKRK